jgi:hypothetical protein
MMVKNKFNYPADADLEKCRNWVMHVAGSSLRNFKSMLTRDWLKKGKNPFAKYNMIKDHQWEAFNKMRMIDEAKEKSAKFTALAKMNKWPHHLGMIGFAEHREEWQRQDEARRMAGIPDLYEGVAPRGKAFLRARIPKKLKEGATKYNELGFEEVQNALIEASKDSRSFKVCRGHDLLTKVLGTLEHHGRVRGVQSKMSWSAVETWLSDASSFKSW